MSLRSELSVVSVSYLIDLSYDLIFVTYRVVIMLNISLGTNMRDMS